MIKIPLIVYGTDFAGRDERVSEVCAIRGARYICFTDRNASELPAPWEAHPPVKQFECPRLTNIWHKLHPHLVLPDHALSLYLNASVGLIADPTVTLKSGFSGFALQRHRHRHCLFEEAKFCRDIGVTDPEELKPQLQDYSSKVKLVQRPTGLWEAGALIRDNSKQTQLVDSLWWEHLCRYPKRDQVVLAYLNTQYDSWFTHGMITDIPGTFDNSEYFTLTSHGGPLPCSSVEAFRRFPMYMKRKAQWAENVRRLSPEQDDAVPLA